MSEHQDALGTLTYGVYIATSKAEDKTNGLTLGWVSQVSLDPPLVAIAVCKEWYSHKLLSEGDHFIVHVLADDQIEIAKFFGSTHGWDDEHGTRQFEVRLTRIPPGGTNVEGSEVHRQEEPKPPEME